MNGTGDVSYVSGSGVTSDGGTGGGAGVDGDGERARLVAALAATDRRDAGAWLRLLRHDYAVAKAVGTRDVWARLATAYRGPASLPTDQRRSEAFALIQLDEARVKIHMGSTDTRTFLKATRTIPHGRSNWALWRASVVFEAQQGDAAAARQLLTECRTRFSGTVSEFVALDRLLKDGGVSAVARLSIDDDIPSAAVTAAGAGAAPVAGAAGCLGGGGERAPVPMPAAGLPRSAVSAGASLASAGAIAVPPVTLETAPPTAVLGQRQPRADGWAAAATGARRDAAVGGATAAVTGGADARAGGAPLPSDVAPAVPAARPRAAGPQRVPRPGVGAAPAAAGGPGTSDALGGGPALPGPFAGTAAAAAPAMTAAPRPVAQAAASAAAVATVAAPPPAAAVPSATATATAADAVGVDGPTALFPPLLRPVRRRVGSSLAGGRPSSMFFSALSPVAEGRATAASTAAHHGRGGGDGAADASSSSGEASSGRASARSSTASSASGGAGGGASTTLGGSGGGATALTDASALLLDAGGDDTMTTTTRVGAGRDAAAAAAAAATALHRASDPTVTLAVASARGAFSAAGDAAVPPAVAAVAVPAAQSTARGSPPLPALQPAAPAASSARLRFDVPEYIRSFGPRGPGAAPTAALAARIAAPRAAAGPRPDCPRPDSAAAATDDINDADTMVVEVAAGGRRAAAAVVSDAAVVAAASERLDGAARDDDSVVVLGRATGAGGKRAREDADAFKVPFAKAPRVEPVAAAAPASAAIGRLDESTEDDGPHGGDGPAATNVSFAPLAAATAAALTAGPFDNLTRRYEVARVAGRDYLRLDCVGRGGSSRVYRVLGDDMKVYALKRVRLGRMDAASLACYQNEIGLLRRLNSNPAATPHIIRLIDAEVSYETRCVNMVMEYGQCDLSALLAREKERPRQEHNAGLLDDNFLRLIWQQMLQAVQTIHDARIVHGDLKPANFVFVEGALKLIDFGIAKAINNDTTNIVRDAQIGTLNYMSPEAILDVSGGGLAAAAAAGARGTPLMKLGRASDIWSLGCILYQMVWGRTPFADLSLIQKLHAIVSTDAPVALPPLVDADLGSVIAACLRRDPAARPAIGGADGLLAHPFLRRRGHADSASLATASRGVARVFGEIGAGRYDVSRLADASTAARLASAAVALGDVEPSSVVGAVLPTVPPRMPSVSLSAAIAPSPRAAGALASRRQAVAPAPVSGGATALAAAIKHGALHLRAAPAASDKENASAAGAPGGLEAVLRQGLHARFASLPAASARAASDDDVMDTTWGSAQ